MTATTEMLNLLKDLRTDLSRIKNADGSLISVEDQIKNARMIERIDRVIIEATDKEHQK